jgi:mono/diheme cytochrome c family protein
MTQHTAFRTFALAAFAPIMVAASLLAPAPLGAQATATQVMNAPGEARLHLYDARDFGIDPTQVTFTRDIAPILQRSCQTCHRPDGGGPMPLITYQQVRPWAPLIKYRTAIRDRMGAMPPWYVEKDIGIQHYKNDPSLSDRELALIQAWADNGAPQGNPADMPAPIDWSGADAWTIRPDLVVRSSPIVVEGSAPDWWGEIEPIDIPLTENRYVKAVQVREVNDVPTDGSGRETVGGKYVVHHMIWRTRVPNSLLTSSWPVHEVGRNADVFGEGTGPLLHAGSRIESESVHLHSNGRTTTAQLEIAFEFHPEGYQPIYQTGLTALGSASDIDIEAGLDGQRLDAYTVVQRPTKIISFEPHLHAPGERMCLEAIWGFKAETLACVGYDHNWVRTYVFEEGYQPLLPTGTVLHIIGYMNNSETNPNVADPRNWQGSGNRSVANMFIDLGLRATMSEERFAEEVRQRVEQHRLTKNDYFIGCPLCLAMVATPGPTPEAGGTAAGADNQP